MKTILTLAFLAGLPLAASAQVSKEDIKKLTTAGISDDVIVSYVKANGGMAKLSAEDLVELKKAGASEKLLSSVLSVSSAPEPRTTVVENRVTTAPATTYVVDSRPYYYTPSPAYYSDYSYPSYSYSGYYPYYSSYYPRSYSYPRSYYYSSCYPRSYYYSPGVSIGVGFSSGRHHYSSGHHSSPRGHIGVSGYRR